MTELRERVGLQEKRKRPGDEAVAPSTDPELEALVPAGCKYVFEPEHGDTPHPAALNVPSERAKE